MVDNRKTAYKNHKGNTCFPNEPFGMVLMKQQTMKECHTTPTWISCWTCSFHPLCKQRAGSYIMSIEIVPLGRFTPKCPKVIRSLYSEKTPPICRPNLRGNMICLTHIYKYIAQGHFGKSSFTTGILRVIMLVWSSAREASELLVQIHRI